jgi:hypothetical protein
MISAPPFSGSIMGAISTIRAVSEDKGSLEGFVEGL